MHPSRRAAPDESSAAPPVVAASPSRRIAVFPGQFDPVTRGHLDVIQRGTVLFDEVIVGVGNNPDKRELFAQAERAELVRTHLSAWPRASVRTYNGLTADFVREVGATAILRGIRDVADLRYEFQLALANRAISGVETVFIMTGDQYALTSSSLIRQVVMLGGDPRTLAPVVPDNVVDKLIDWQRSHARANVPDAPAT